GFGYVFSYTISNPLLRLKREVSRASEKDFKYRIEDYSRDEIGQLARAFNALIKRIKGSRQKMHEKIEAQTREIEEQKQELENQQKAILNVLEDVSEEKDKAAQQKDKIEAILYSIGDGVFVIDKDYKITIFNDVAAKISGYSAKEAIGEKYDQILKFVDEKEEKDKKEFIKTPIKKGDVEDMGRDTVLITKNGHRIPVADSAAPLKDKDGNILGCVVVFRDVTKERQIDKAKTEFVSLASHQLRTPLSSINWYAEMLLDGDAGKLNEEQMQFLKEIYKGNQRMVNLVNALLNVSRIELGKLAVDPKPLDFSEIAQSVLKELKPSIEKKKLQVDTNFGRNIPKIQADPKLVRIVFQNLLSNAVKYTPEKGKVGLKLKKLKNYLKIEVSDTGYGIPKEQHDKIFTKMFRADNVKEKDAEGNGLGLYIVKSITNQAGGEIWFKSEKDQGTTFHVKFPLEGMSKKEGSRTLNEIK
ncbi:MAG TPA: ATP-binding protein, partial [Patescibacteria group bacterium]|nr:ATP-binding protein [Patescibacteria group bacterium]